MVYLKVTHGLRFNICLFFLGAALLMSFHEHSYPRSFCFQPQKHDASGRGCRTGVSYIIFFRNWNGGAPLGVGALCKLHTLCIESGGTATVGGVITSVA